jgi:serine/threonine protein kinase
MLFFALTGSVVFPLDAPEGKLWAHVSEPPPSVSALRPAIPAALDGVIARALAKDPHQRYDSAPALAAAIRDAASGTRAADADPRIATLLHAAHALRDSGVSTEAGRLLDTIGRVASQAQLLHDRATEPERIERELAELRSRHVVGKSQRVDALAQQLSASRRASAGLAAFNERLDHMLVELDTARAGSGPSAGEVRALCDRLDEMARELEP